MSKYSTLSRTTEIPFADTNTVGRINSSKFINTTINSSTFNGGIFTLSQQNDRKIVAAGTFTTYNATSFNRIIRFNADGSVDGTFSIGTGFNNVVQNLIVLPDGRIIVVGNFTSYDGTGCNRIVCLLANGTIDSSFVYGSGFNGPVFSVCYFNGKIIVGGDFTSYDGTGVTRIVSLNLDGSINSSFNIGTGFNDEVWKVNYDSIKNKILATGKFTTYNSITTNQAVIINPNGSKDTSFSTGLGFIGSSLDKPVNIQYQGNNILISVDRATLIPYTYNGTLVNSSIIRVDNTGAFDIAFPMLTIDDYDVYYFYVDQVNLNKIIYVAYDNSLVGRVYSTDINGNLLKLIFTGTGFFSIGIHQQ